MARSLSSVKLISSLAESVSVAVNRRGFAAAATQQGGIAASTRQTETMMKQTTKEAANQEESWIPDPVTGYYRPANRGDDIDVAELRAMLLNNKRN